MPKAKRNGAAKNGAHKNGAARKKNGHRPPRFTAKTADKHILYQLAVQTPETEVEFLDTWFKKIRGKKALSLREDFCGTAILCAEWVKSAEQRTATGLDIDRGVLAWGKQHNLAPLGEAQDRITLLRQDVRD